MNALILSALMGVVMMFSGIFLRNKPSVRLVATIGLFLVLTANLLETYGLHFIAVSAEGMLQFNRFVYLVISIILFCTWIFFLLSSGDMEKVGVNYAEYFALIFFVLCGIILASSFTSLLVLFLGIEIISIPLYILTGTDKKNLKSNEASLKYFLLGAFSTGLMLMGIALVYGDAGTFRIDGLVKSQPDESTVLPSALMVCGMFLLLFSMAFKVSAAPFHFWTPDVYDGAPTVFTSFMATIIKSAGFIAFIRLFYLAFEPFHSTWLPVVAVITALTLLIGNITAVFQQSVKRMLAYSSIAQAGFMLMAILSSNSVAMEGILLYMTAYSLATVGLFAILIKMKDYTYDGFNGFARYQPLLAASAVIFLLSLAGIPLTAGFLAKFYMLKAVAMIPGYLWLVLFAVVMAAVSVYYYFRVIQAMYFKEGQAASSPDISNGFKWTIVLVAVLIVVIGIFPQLLLNWLYF